MWRPLAAVNTGQRVLRSVELQYPEAFAAYLARFLINWEPVTRRWWEQRLSEGADFLLDEAADDGVVGTLGLERRDLYLSTRFSSLVTSVEVGLASFTGASGAAKLAASLKSRYTTPAQKRALAQLLTLIEPASQPDATISALVGEVDNARVTNLTLVTAGSGYSATPPEVQFDARIASDCF